MKWLTQVKYRWNSQWHICKGQGLKRTAGLGEHEKQIGTELFTALLNDAPLIFQSSPVKAITSRIVTHGYFLSKGCSESFWLNEDICISTFGHLPWIQQNSHKATASLHPQLQPDWTGLVWVWILYLVIWVTQHVTFVWFNNLVLVTILWSNKVCEYHSTISQKRIMDIEYNILLQNWKQLFQ